MFYLNKSPRLYYEKVCLACAGENYVSALAAGSHSHSARQTTSDKLQTTNYKLQLHRFI